MLALLTLGLPLRVDLAATRELVALGQRERIAVHPEDIELGAIGAELIGCFTYP